MPFQKSLAAALVATTILGGAALAADTAAKPAAAQETPAQKAVDRDVGKLSKDGAQAFRDLHLARIAIYEADPAQAKSLIAKAQAALAKAKTDETVYDRAEDDLRTPGNLASGKAREKTATDKAATDKAKPAAVAWVPVDAQLTLGEDFQATPVKASAVTEANKSLAQGDKKAALEKLRLADVDVNFVMAVLPLEKTTADVDQAATLLGQGKYYEANTVLKTAEDRMRFDVIDVIGVQKAAAHKAAAAPDAKAAAASDAKAAAASDAKAAK